LDAQCIAELEVEFGGVEAGASQRIAELEAQLVARDLRIADLEAQLAARGAESAALREQVAALTKTLAELADKLGRNSRNSNLPPSSDPPGVRKNRESGKSKDAKRKRGGQPGHRGSRRELLPEAEVDEIVDLFPSQCENCWEPLPERPDSSPQRHQLTEVPPVEPHTTEFRRHSVECLRCGHTTCASCDQAQIPSSPFGPRLMALIALLTGVYHISRRRTVELLADVLGVRISLGAVSAVEARVSEAAKPAFEEACAQVEEAEVKHTDGTSWRQAGSAMSLWTIATTMVTVFKIVSNSTADMLKPLFGALKGILVSDRGKNLTFWAMEFRQICWAHLLRKFISFSERDGPAATFGSDLLNYTGILFEYWHDYKAGHLSREMFRAWIAPLRTQMEALLERAVAAKIEGLSGSCADILAHRAALWTFVDRDDVEPTNNHAERELRAFVLWRKRSFGTQSDRGNLFAERMMTVAHTARKQKRNVLDFLTECCEAWLSKTDIPSLLRT